MDAEFTAKLERLSRGADVHPQELIPEAGICEHGYTFDRNNRRLITNFGEIFTGITVIQNVSVYQLQTANMTNSFISSFLQLCAT